MNGAQALNFALGEEDIKVVYSGGKNKFSSLTLTRDQVRYHEDRGYYLLKDGAKLLEGSVRNLSYSDEGVLILELDQSYIDEVHEKLLQELNERVLSTPAIKR